MQILIGEVQVVDGVTRLVREGKVIDPEFPPLDLIEDLAKAAYCDLPESPWSQAAEITRDAHRNAAKAILKALAERVKA